MSDIDRQTAQRALADAAKNPSLFSTKQLKMLMQAAEAPPTTPSNFGEGGSILGTGPTGMGVLEKQIESPEDEVIRLAQDPNIKRGMKLTPKMTTVTSEEELKQRKKTHDDSNTTSASRRRDLIRDPEFIPPQKPNTVYGGINPLDMFSTAVDSARSNLPAFAGGKVEHYLEPPITQFRRDMAPVLMAQGIDPNSLGHESDQYKEYADQRWAELYDQAKAEGRPVVRVAFKKARDLAEKVELGSAKAIGQGVAAAVGVDEAAFGGRIRRLAADSPEQLENYERLAESSPGARVLGQFAGAGSSIGLGGLASRGIGGVGALAGAARGAASSAGTATSMAFSEDRLPGVGEVAKDAAFGAPFGMLAGAFGKHLRQTTPLKNIEDAGMGETEMVRGVRRSQRATDIQEAAAKRMGPGREKDYLVGELEPTMVKGARELESMTKKEIGVPQRQYFDMSKDVRRPQTPLLKEAMKIHAGGSYESGGALPVHEGQNRELRKIIAQASHAEIVPAPGGQVVKKAGNPSSFDLSSEDAAAQGIDVDGLMRSHMGHGGEAPGSFVVRVTPRELNPEQTESIIAMLHEKIAEGKNAGMLDSLHRASREVRDQFPAMGPIDPNASHSINLGAGEQLPLKGWSAWQHQAAEKTRRARRVIDAGGFGGGKTPESLGRNQAESYFSRTSAYKTPGRPPDADEALEELARLGGDEQGLKEIAGQAGLDEAKGGLARAAARPRTAILEALEYRLDPLLTFYGPGFGAIAPTISPTLSGQQKLENSMDPATYQKLQRYMGQNPFRP